MSIAAQAPSSPTSDIAAIPGLRELWAETVGDPRVCIAVLDGPVDLSHPCFVGAKLALLGSPESTPAANGRMSAHGTHVASVLFAQHESGITGVAPGCRGIVIPIFFDGQGRSTAQSELAHAINRAI